MYIFLLLTYLIFASLPSHATEYGLIAENIPENITETYHLPADMLNHKIDGMKPLDYDALMETEEYKKLTKATQGEKDAFLNKHSGDYFSVYSRHNVTRTLLAGANPNVNEGVKNYAFCNAIQEGDLQLVALFFEKKLNIKLLLKHFGETGSPWWYCKSIEMAQLLIDHKVPLLDKETKIHALNDAIEINAPYNYISFLLKKCPEAATVYPPGILSRYTPLITAYFCRMHKFPWYSKHKELFKLLVDYGADPYLKNKDDDDGGLTPVNYAKRKIYSSYSTEYESVIAGLQQYYHVRKDLVPAVLQNRFNVLKRIFAPEIADLIAQITLYGKQVFNGPIYFKPEKWHLQGRVPKEYENYKNNKITLPE